MNDNNNDQNKAKESLLYLKGYITALLMCVYPEDKSIILNQERCADILEVIEGGLK